MHTHISATETTGDFLYLSSIQRGDRSMSTLCAGKFCNQAIIKGTYESRDTEYEIETQSKLHYENSVFGLPGDGNEI